MPAPAVRPACHRLRNRIGLVHTAPRLAVQALSSHRVPCTRAGGGHLWLCGESRLLIVQTLSLMSRLRLPKPTLDHQRALEEAGHLCSPARWRRHHPAAAPLPPCRRHRRCRFWRRSGIARILPTPTDAPAPSAAPGRGQAKVSPAGLVRGCSLQGSQAALQQSNTSQVQQGGQTAQGAGPKWPAAVERPARWRSGVYRQGGCQGAAAAGIWPAGSAGWE